MQNLLKIAKTNEDVTKTKITVKQVKMNNAHGESFLSSLPWFLADAGEFKS